MDDLRTPDQLYDYQMEAYGHLAHHDEAMLCLGMGLGKTPITLTSLAYRMSQGLVEKTLIFGPLRVIQAVWAREARKWTHTRHLRFSVVHGDRTKRLRALFAPADIYLCNYENMNWLAEVLDHYYLSQGKPLPFQLVVYDEISKLKNSTSLRVSGGKRDRKRHGQRYVVKVTGWRKIMNEFPYKVGLTGTPASNGYIDLHGQYLVLDGGKRLGEYKTHYENSYFESDYKGWSKSPTELGKRAIEQKISDITLKMDTRDYLDLPPVKESNIMVDLPPRARKVYEEVEQLLFSSLDRGSEIELFSKTSISNKCLQICNGSPFVNQVGSGDWYELHDAKLDALEDIIEEAAGAPVLCGYSFKPDAMRIMERFKKLKPVSLSDIKSRDTERTIDRWNDGKIRLMIGHPGSMAYGLDGLQENGHILAWFGLNWSLELYDQTNARLDRNGQSQPVSIARILCKDTVDLAVADALIRKANDQQGLKSALDRYRKGITTNELELTFL